MSHPYHGLNELREMFLKFFETKGHLRLPSFSLVPQNDKSILLINAGMTPMKPWFKGEEEPPCRRVCTCQKCIRTGDIDNVGKTTAPAPAAPAPRSTMTAARSTAAASPAAPWAVTATAISRYGTTCSPSSTTTATTTTPN